MGNYTEYFKKVCYKPTWEIGDRVFGKQGKIPFIGTVLNDTLISEDVGPQVIIDLDLPINGKTIIITKPKLIKRLKNYGDSQKENDSGTDSDNRGMAKGRSRKSSNRNDT